MKGNGLRQPGGEVWWSNGCHVQDLLFRLLLGFREEIHDAFTPSKGPFTCGKAIELLLYLPATEAHLRQPARRTSQQTLAVAYFYAPQGQSAASASSLANQATNRCSHPSLNHLTLHWHSISGFKGHQIQHHLSEIQSNRIHYLARKTRRWNRTCHLWQRDTELRRITSKASSCIVIIPSFVISTSEQGEKVRLLPRSIAWYCTFLFS